LELIDQVKGHNFREKTMVGLGRNQGWVMREKVKKEGKKGEEDHYPSNKDVKTRYTSDKVGGC